MLHNLGSRSFICSVALLTITLYGRGFAFICAGSLADTVNNNGNNVMGVPLGGIGGGNFNFLPNGDYSTTYCNIAPPAGTMPLVTAYAQQGTAIWSSDLKDSTANAMKTTYTGYWPRLTMQYAKSGMPVRITLEAFSPIIPGDNKNSSLPIAIYTFTLTDTTTVAETAAVALSNSAAGNVIPASGTVSGIKNGTGTAATVAVMVKNDSLGYSLVTYGATKSLFTASGQLNNAVGGILASKIYLAPSQTRTITFTLSWNNQTAGWYRNYYTDAESLATYALVNSAMLRTKVLNWQNKILNSNFPTWLQDIIINNCHPYNSMTAWTTASQNTLAGVGTYSMQESSDEGDGTTAGIGSIDQCYTSSIGLPLFAPTAAWSEATRIANVQQAGGMIPHLYSGSGNDVRADDAAKFVLMCYRDYMWTGDSAKLAALYPDIKSAIAWIMSMDTKNNDGLTDDSDLDTYDNPYWGGWDIPSREYDNELDLAAFKAGAAMGTLFGDTIANTYNNYFTKASTSFEHAASTGGAAAGGGFWDTTHVGPTGLTGYYTGSTDLGGSGKGLASWEGQFTGQWYADLFGLGPLHPENRIERAIQFTNAVNVDSRTGATNPSYMMMAALPTATLANTTSYFNGSENDATGGDAANIFYVSYIGYPVPQFGCPAIYHGNPDIGLRVAQMMWNATYSRFKRVWNMSCKADTGGRGGGWGAGRYMAVPGVFGTAFAITGFAIDVHGKRLWLKPSVPAAMGDSLVNAPLINPMSCGTLSYNLQAGNVQRLVVGFDSALSFRQLYVRKRGSAATVSVTNNGALVPATIAVYGADTSEYLITFGSLTAIGTPGAVITVGAATGTDRAPATVASVFAMAVNMKSGIISYVLPQRSGVAVTLVNPKGAALTLLQAEQASGSHALYHDWKREPAGVYFMKIKAGGMQETKEIINIR
jgi:uncharacterized protein (DUF608 family)